MLFGSQSASKTMLNKHLWSMAIWWCLNNIASVSKERPLICKLSLTELKGGISNQHRVMTANR